jgi:hypothetical protein
LRPPTNNRIARRRCICGARLLASCFTALLAAGLLPGCSSSLDSRLTVFADPGKYDYHSCDQIAGMQKHWRSREQELKQLMDKAEQSSGGAVVNVIAYQADYVGAREELKVLEATARTKNCKPQQQLER